LADERAGAVGGLNELAVVRTTSRPSTGTVAPWHGKSVTMIFFNIKAKPASTSR